MDRIDQMLDMLGDDIPEIIWEREAADVARPEDWGAVELRSEPDAQWADGQATDRIWSMDLYLATGDQGSQWAERVDNVLRRFDEEAEWITWEMAERSWQPNIQKVLWRWRIRLYGEISMQEQWHG